VLKKYSVTFTVCIFPVFTKKDLIIMFLLLSVVKCSAGKFDWPI